MPSSNGPLWRHVLQLITQETNLSLSSESPRDWRPLLAPFSPIYAWRKAGLVVVIVWPSQNANLDYVILDISGGRRKSKTLSVAKIRQEFLCRARPHTRLCHSHLTAEPNTGGCANNSMCEQNRETGGQAGRWQNSLQETSDLTSRSL